MQLIVARPIDNCVFAVLNISNSRGVNVPPPIAARASCFKENSTTDSEELRRLTLSPQA